MDGLSARGLLGIATMVLLSAPAAVADDPAALQDQAGEAVSRGDLKTALNLLTRAHHAKPDDVDIQMNLGIVAAWDGQFDLASATFSAILKAHPKHFDAQFNLGRALIAQGKTKRGYQALRNAQKLAPKGDSSPTVELAGAQLATGDEKAARKTLASMKPASANGHLLLVFMDLRAGQFDAASRHAASAAALDNSLTTQLAVATTDIHVGNYDAAKTRLKALMKVAPATQANTPYLLGLLEFSRGNFSGAGSWFVEAKGRSEATFDPKTLDIMAFPTSADRAYLRWARATTTPSTFSFTAITSSGPPACQPAVIVEALYPAGKTIAQCPERDIRGHLSATGFEPAGTPGCADEALKTITAQLPKKVRCSISLSVQTY